MNPDPAQQDAKQPQHAQPGRWREATPELIITAIAVAVAALAGAAVSGWPGVVAVAVGVSVLALIVARALIPSSAAQPVRRAKDKQQARAISGYAKRRFIVSTSLASRPAYESDLRPVLERILAARLADSRGVNLYTEPAQARAAFCRSRADESLWPWIDPKQARSGNDRTDQRNGTARAGLAPPASADRVASRLAARVRCASAVRWPDRRPAGRSGRRSATVNG